MRRARQVLLCLYRIFAVDRRKLLVGYSKIGILCAVCSDFNPSDNYKYGQQITQILDIQKQLVDERPSLHVVSIIFFNSINTHLVAIANTQWEI